MHNRNARRKLTISTTLLLLTALALSACSNFSQSSFKAEKSTADLVTTLMQEEALAHTRGQVTDAFHAKVKTAYEKYQTAGVAYALIIKGYDSTKDKAKLDSAVSDFSQALSDLLLLIQPKK